jgi:hypothetical protein
MFWLALAAVALGYWEAATVAALRHGLGIPDGTSNVLALERLTGNLLRREQLRELCPILLLGILAGTAAHTAVQVALLFGWGFALWDLSYYGFLRLLVGWPRSLVVLDLLFLVPRPWLAPVWLPVTLSTVTAIGCGAALLGGVR